MEPIVRHGTGVSPGVGIGPARVVDRRLRSVPRFELAPEQAEEQLARFEAAVDAVREDLGAVEDKAGRELGPGLAQIIDAQRMMLDDASFLGPVRARIRDARENPEWAVKSVGEILSERFARISDPYLRERGNDVDDLANRVLRTLMGEHAFRMEDLLEPVVLIAHDLSPADTAMLDRSRILGFATNVGGRTSHTAIIARSMEIPAVVGMRDVTEHVRDGDEVVIDGNEGTVVVQPSAAVLTDYRAKKVSYAEHEARLMETRDLPASTPDGHDVRLLANIERPAEVESALQHGAMGIGLYRSEFLYLRNPAEVPDEEEHYRDYRAVLEQTSPKPVTIRTLDLGGEKDLPAAARFKEQDNALLGLRAVRHSLRERALFRAQLRGLLRASVHGPLRIVLPLISGLEELREVKEIIDQTRRELTEQGHDVAADVPLGVMIEVPAAAMIVDHLAAEADFFAVGTNDLIQYMLAVDRNNEEVAYLYEPLHPGILRLLERIVTAARDHDRPVNLCGETAADPLTAMLYLGFGIQEFSMSPSAIPIIKNVIRTIPYADARAMLRQALAMRTDREVEEFALERLMAHFPDGFMDRGGTETAGGRCAR